jgi:hypothetical protein
MGYTHETVVAYAAGTSGAKLRNYKAVHLEKRLAWLLMLAGVAWAWRDAAGPVSGAPGILANLSPLEVCAAGVLLRLHAAWHRATKVV